MSTDSNLIIQSTGSSSTETIGANIGARLKGGEVIELASDLGGGKTTFTRGLVKGAGSTDHVSSPTFTISKVYNAPKFEIHHFDFYRLPSAGTMAHEIAELTSENTAVLIVEWANVVTNVLPKERLDIRITATGENTREIAVSYPASLAYLLEGLA